VRGGIEVFAIRKQMDVEVAQFIDHLQEVAQPGLGQHSKDIC
jgi:hypothetical protein